MYAQPLHYDIYSIHHIYAHIYFSLRIHNSLHYNIFVLSNKCIKKIFVVNKIVYLLIFIVRSDFKEELDKNAVVEYSLHSTNFNTI